MRKNKFSKLLSMFLALTMTLSLASCGSAQSSTEQKENSGVTDTVIEQETEKEQPAEEPSEEETEETQEPVLEKVDINLAALKGPTALGMLDLLEKNDNGEAANNYNVTLAGAPDEIVGKIVSGDLDIAAVPTNVASTLYNKTQGGVKLAALNTMGVLYILEKGDSIQSVADLAGKRIRSSFSVSTTCA